MTISTSPDRHTFQANAYIERCKEQGIEPDENYLNVYKLAKQQDEENMVDPKWKNNNLEHDLRSTDWILGKVRSNTDYAQNLYAALCNNEFTKREMWPVLKEEKWSCSWRYAGGIIANMRQEGDYMDWYCSGIKGTIDPPYYGEPERHTFVSESVITEEIKDDLFKLGWLVVPESKDIDI